MSAQCISAKRIIVANARYQKQLCLIVFYFGLCSRMQKYVDRGLPVGVCLASRGKEATLK